MNSRAASEKRTPAPQSGSSSWLLYRTATKFEPPRITTPRNEATGSALRARSLLIRLLARRMISASNTPHIPPAASQLVGPHQGRAVACADTTANIVEILGFRPLA